MPKSWRQISFATMICWILGSAPGCSKEKGGDDATAGTIKGQKCQSPQAGHAAMYLCPEGYFCKYKDGENMSDSQILGECQPMDVYQPCLNWGPCESNNPPKCGTVNETPYCDLLDPKHFCECEKPGPFGAVGNPGPVKPATTK